MKAIAKKYGSPTILYFPSRIGQYFQIIWKGYWTPETRDEILVEKYDRRYCQKA